jgi:hypothetical protein
VKRRDIIAFGVTVAGCAATCFGSYYGGRYLVLPLLLPPGLVPGLVTLAAMVLLVMFGVSRPVRPLSLVLRIVVAVGIYAVLSYPSRSGDGYFDMGRRAHVRDVITPEVVAHLRSVVAAKIVPSQLSDGGSLSDADLPMAVSMSAWRSPGFMHYRHDPKLNRTEIDLVWGGALIFHHGVLIVSPPDAAGPEKDSTYKTIETLYPGVFIYNDWN